MKLGDRVKVKPKQGLKVQRSESAFGQFLPPEGGEVLVDSFLMGRIDCGELEIVDDSQS